MVKIKINKRRICEYFNLLIINKMLKYHVLKIKYS